MKKLFVIFIIFLISIPFVFAADLKEEEEKIIDIRIVYEGSTAIRDSLSSKTPYEESSILTTATKQTFTKTEFPYIVNSKDTEMRLLSHRCDEKLSMCGYWITCYRNDREVATDSPIWIYPPPYVVVVSSKYYTGIDEKQETTDINKAVLGVITIKENPKEAVENVLLGYCDRQPIGRAITGMKE